MAIEYKVRDQNGDLGEPIKAGSDPTTEEQISALGMQLTQEKLANMQKDAIINGLGEQLAQVKLEIMAMKGGGV
ncbi:XkdW family protein [Solibacillus cecembensis]|uniref:XkdW family protein n=1 Tax=Solibacillus cecembensis TaxID=459347 RepID=UPI003D012B03